MAADDSEWVLESVAGYLSSPDWLIPLADFMETKCSVFDDEDEHKLSYTEIHQQYKLLVERLLENYMREVGVSEQQLMKACANFSHSRALQAVFQPLMATDDFQMFHSLMLQKNTELQLQALQVIKQRNGGLPECLTDGSDVMSELEQQEMKILQDVLRRSKEEYELELCQRSRDREDAASTSSSVCEAPVGCQLANGISEEREPKKQESAETDKAKAKAKAKAAPSRDALPAVRAPLQASVPASAAQKSPKDAKGSRAAVKQQQPPPQGEEELQQRTQYLKQQRDRLQALKKEQMLKTPADSSPRGPEPSTEISVDEKKKLQKRKHIAEKLKEEVIKK